MESSDWGAHQLGGVELELKRAAVRALTQAHSLALGAHAIAEMTSGDTYGHTMYVRANELMLELGSEVPGVSMRRPPHQRSRFKMLVVDETNTGIYVWRYSDDPSVERSAARFDQPVSSLRRAMATLSQARGAQLTIEDAAMSDEELAERDALEAALRQRGSVVFLAFGSNAQAGVFSKGLAQLTLLDDGVVSWDHWEPLPDLAEGEQRNGRVSAPKLRLVDPHPETARFDSDGASDDVFDLRPRPKADHAKPADPESGMEAESEASGSEDGE